MNKENKYNMPEHTWGALRRYVDDGLEPGGFLTAVLEHELFEAFARADHLNQLTMMQIIKHIYNEEPCNCHGYKGVVSDWCEYIRKENSK